MWETLKRLAPTVASALGTPLAGAFIAGLGEIFGQDNPTLDSVAKTFTKAQLTPDQIVKIKELELKAQQDEREGQFKYAELEIKDRQGARERDSVFVQMGRHNWRADIMFVLAVVVTCSLVWLVWKDPSINEYVKGIFTLVLGRFLGYLDNIYNFEFGTTRGSQSKDSTINNLTAK